ncbi:uncharacterized protein LOC115198489 [Salmo trutta]|uniref:uncharacterized protein LOC115198489 n=1 Tax=Salmo trutta TaxID=8032 RepID=UPI0011302F2A|nr:uncharacterized protein LOC115198489 [Salmo trutta]
MDDLSVKIVNGPLTILNIFANIFFAFCMLCPPHGREGLKQPVKLLLGSMVFCTTVYLVSLIAAQCLWMVSASSECFYAAYLIMVYMAATSMSTSLWLNFFYYTQIVPAQRALFTWVKRNIKSIIYWGLFGDRMFFMFQFAVRTTGEFYSSGEGKSVFGLCVMVGSSCATVCYLHRHMKSMKKSGSPFSPQSDEGHHRWYPAGNYLPLYRTVDFHSLLKQGSFLYIL